MLKIFFELDENKQPNELANQKLENLKNRLRERLPKQNVHDYQANWLNEDSESKPSLTTDHIGNLPDDLEECKELIDDENAPKTLCVDVFRQLARVILEEIANIKSVSAVEKEKDEHQKFGAERAKHFRGRKNYLDKISEYIIADNQKPLVLWGKSGSGKTALMARSAKEIHQSKPIVRFIGATPQSSDIRSLLESLCEQISAEYPADETAIPADYNELIKEFPKRLARATKEKPLVLILDALDQLSEADNAQNLRWLPDKLPENVRLIVSTLRGESLKILERKFPENIIQLEPMTQSEGDDVLDLWLKDANRTLQANQRAEVLTKFVAAKGLPLYLKFAFEEARLWHSYAELKPLPTDVEGIIGDLFKRLSDEANHGAMMVSRSLGYLAAARYGLTEDELLDVLSEDEEVLTDFINRSPTERAKEETERLKRLPVVVWSRLYFDLEPYLTERAGADAALLSFYHRQLGEVTAQKYLSGDDKKRAHRHLADYFERQDYWHETPAQYRNRIGEFPKSARRANGRKTSEFAWQLRQFGDYEHLEQIHTNLDFLESKTAAGLVFELAKDFTEALKIIPSERPLRRIIRLLEEALRRDIHFIARHRENYPQALFQCLWNSGWWYDCPQAANHYEEKDGPWSRDGEKLYQLLEKWREQKETETQGFRWLRALCPPQQHLGTAQIAILKGHGHSVSCVVISPDGRRIVSGSFDKTIRVWDMETSEELAVLEGHWRFVDCVAISSDGRRIVSSSHDKTVRVWDMETSEELAVLFGHEDFVSSIAISSDNRRIVSGSADETVIVWDMGTGEELAVLIGHGWVVSCVAISPDGRRIVSGSFDETVRVWDLESGTELKVLNGHTGHVESVAISPDSQRIVSSSADKTIRVWDMETGKELMVMKGHKHLVKKPVGNEVKKKHHTYRFHKPEDGGSVKSVGINYEGTRIIGGLWWDAICIWDMETGEELKVLKGNENSILSVAISPDSRRIVSGSADHTIRVWDMEMGEELKVLKGHKDFLNSVAISPDNQRIVSGSNDKTVRIWKTETGEELKVLKGHKGYVFSVAISPDSQRIVSSSADKTIRVWDMETGKELKVIKRKGGQIEGVFFSSDGQWIVSDSRVWNIATGKTRQINQAIAADFNTVHNPQKLPFSALSQPSDTLVQNAAQDVIAFFPESINRIVSHPGGRTWTFIHSDYSCNFSIIRLEGEVDKSTEV